MNVVGCFKGRVKFDVRRPLNEHQLRLASFWETHCGVKGEAKLDLKTGMNIYSDFAA